MVHIMVVTPLLIRRKGMRRERKSKSSGKRRKQRVIPRTNTPRLRKHAPVAVSAGSETVEKIEGSVSDLVEEKKG